MKEVLNPLEIKQFIENGYVRIDNAFSGDLAEVIRERLWKDIDADPANPSTWTRPVIRLGMYAEQPFIASANTSLLHSVFDQLVGKGKWLPCKSMGTFPVRFPSAVDPGDTGWHVDVSFATDHPDFMQWRVNWLSRGRGLLMLFLYSDIGEKDAPTRIRIGSHLDIARVLKPAGEAGLTLGELVNILPHLPHQQEVLAIGAAGTVYLCHPFLVHAAQLHRGSEPRFLAQPPLILREKLMQEKEKNNRSPVEIAIERAVM